MPSCYPPGVSGLEREISGPDHETQETRWCDSCQRETPHSVWRYRRHENAECDECLHESERGLGPDSF